MQPEEISKNPVKPELPDITSGSPSKDRGGFVWDETKRGDYNLGEPSGQVTKKEAPTASPTEDEIPAWLRELGDKVVQPPALTPEQAESLPPLETQLPSVSGTKVPGARTAEELREEMSKEEFLAAEARGNEEFQRDVAASGEDFKNKGLREEAERQRQAANGEKGVVINDDGSIEAEVTEVGGSAAVGAEPAEVIQVQAPSASPEPKPRPLTDGDVRKAAEEALRIAKAMEQARRKAAEAASPVSPEPTSPPAPEPPDDWDQIFQENVKEAQRKRDVLKGQLEKLITPDPRRRGETAIKGVRLIRIKDEIIPNWENSDLLAKFVMEGRREQDTIDKKRTQGERDRLSGGERVQWLWAEKIIFERLRNTGFDPDSMMDAEITAKLEEMEARAIAAQAQAGNQTSEAQPVQAKKRQMEKEMNDQFEKLAEDDSVTDWVSNLAGNALLPSNWGDKDRLQKILGTGHDLLNTRVTATREEIRKERSDWGKLEALLQERIGSLTPRRSDTETGAAGDEDTEKLKEEYAPFREVEELNRQYDELVQEFGKYSLLDEDGREKIVSDEEKRELARQLEEYRQRIKGAIGRGREKMRRGPKMPRGMYGGGEGSPSLPDISEVGLGEFINQFRARARALIEEQKNQSFDAKWQLVYPLESALMSLWPVAGKPDRYTHQGREYTLAEIREELTAEFDALRSVHNYAYLHQRVSGTTPLIEPANYLGTDTVNRLLHIPEVAQAFRRYESECENYRATRQRERVAKASGNKVEEARQKAAADGMQTELQRWFTERDAERAVDPFWARRVAGGLMCGLHEAARFDVQIDGAGDFFMNRVFNPASRAEVAWNRWGRKPFPALYEAVDLRINGFWTKTLNALYSGFENQAKINGFDSDWAAQQFSEYCERFGIEARLDTVRGKTVAVVTSLALARFEDPDFKLTSTGIPLDQVKQVNLDIDDADNIRKAIFNPGGLLDLPDLSHLVRLWPMFKHLRGAESSDWLAEVSKIIINYFKDKNFPAVEGIDPALRRSDSKEVYPVTVPWTYSFIERQIDSLTPPFTKQDRERILKEVIGSKLQRTATKGGKSTLRVGGEVVKAVGGSLLKALGELFRMR